MIPFRTRDKVGPIIVNFVTMLERQGFPDLKVKLFRRVGMREYNPSVVNSFFLKNGIVSGATVPYAHKQNGVIEHAWRTIFDTAQTIANDGLTPYERYFDRVADVSHLRKWGCVNHISIRPGTARQAGTADSTMLFCRLPQDRGA